MVAGRVAGENATYARPWNTARQRLLPTTTARSAGIKIITPVPTATAGDPPMP